MNPTEKAEIRKVIEILQQALGEVKKEGRA